MNEIFISNIHDWFIKTTKNKNIRLVIVSIEVDVVTKNDVIIKIYSFHLFPVLCKKRSNCWKYRKLCSYFENPYHDEKIVDKSTNLLVSSYGILFFFPEKEMVTFLK